MTFLIVLGALVGCTNEPGACVESIRIDSVKYGWCYQVDSPGACPTFWSSDEREEVKWEFFPSKQCKGQGYEFSCGDGVFEDVESECPGDGGTS
jgi:hypothetical protein